jgi:hypothetical protein
MPDTEFAREWTADEAERYSSDSRKMISRARAVNRGQSRGHASGADHTPGHETASGEPSGKHREPPPGAPPSEEGG